MLKFFVAGGFSMWVVLLFASIALYTSVRFAIAANPRRLALIRAMTWATVFSVLSGVASNLIAVAWKTTTKDELARDPDFPLIVIYGIGEAITPAVLGFTALSLVWLFVAVGTRRVQELAE